MENNLMNQAAPDAGLCGSDREIFQRVWRRVMPDQADNCPIELTPARSASPVPEAETEELMMAQVQPLAPQEIPGGEVQEAEEVQELPAGRDVPCLGRGSAVYAGLLREMIDAETDTARLYQALSRRAGGLGARALGGMAADERRHARRLGAVYFLITGQRYQPRGQGGNRPVPDLMNGLREQFLQEQRESCAYQAAAEETSDECLARLYLELSEDEAGHANTIRALLEQMQ